MHWMMSALLFITMSAAVPKAELFSVRSSNSISTVSHTLQHASHSRTTTSYMSRARYQPKRTVAFSPKAGRPLFTAEHSGLLYIHMVNNIFCVSPFYQNFPHFLDFTLKCVFETVSCTIHMKCVPQGFVMTYSTVKR